MKASVPAAAQPSPEPATAPSVAQAPDQTEAPIPTWDASVGDDADGGIGVPLLELQLVAAVCFLALGAATVWRARRRRRRSLVGGTVPQPDHSWEVYRNHWKYELEAMK